jgi:hypothetical protein
MTVPRPHRIAGAMLAVALFAATMVASTAALAPARAEAATTQSHGYLLIAGPHLQLGRGHEWMGSYSINGAPPGYCIDYGKSTPAASGNADVRSVPGWTAEKAQRISYVLSKWGTTSSNTQAAAVNASVSRLIGNPVFVSDWRASYAPQLNRRDRNVVPLSDRMLAESASLRGPYKVSVAMTHGASVGGTATARVVVRSAANKPVAGTPISLRLGNALPARALPRTTGRDGTATVLVVPSRPGAVSVTATATALVQTGVVRLSIATSTRVQRIATSAAATVRAAGATSFRTSFPVQKLTAAMACTGDCAGAPPVNVSATNASARNKLQVFVVVNGRTVPGKVLTLAPGRGGRFAVVVHDGDKVSLAYRWQSGTGWTGFLNYGSAIVIDCPPAAQVSFTVDCPCDGHITSTLKDVNATRYAHVFTVRIPGKPDRTATVAAHATGTIPGITWTRGQTVRIWNQNQLNGKNFGARVAVTTVNFG